METNFKSLTNEALLILISSKVQNERDLTLEVIDYLREIKLRRLHLSRGYSSLHEFCVKELKYSDGAAYRRIKAMDLVTQTPKALDAIKGGRLNLTVASQTQSFFEHQAKESAPLSKIEKEDLLLKMENKSTREAQAILVSLAPELVKIEERIRSISSDKEKLELVITKTLSAKIKRLKELKFTKSFVEILESLIDKELNQIDPLVKKTRTRKVSPGDARETLRASPEKLKSRYIPSNLKQIIWKRDQGRCSYIDQQTKRRCEAKSWLHIDHVTPMAHGGRSESDNLRLLCANHNRLEAIEKLGSEVMGRYLEL